MTDKSAKSFTEDVKIIFRPILAVWPISVSSYNHPFDGLFSSPPMYLHLIGAFTHTGLIYLPFSYVFCKEVILNTKNKRVPPPLFHTTLVKSQTNDNVSNCVKPHSNIYNQIKRKTTRRKTNRTRRVFYGTILFFYRLVRAIMIRAFREKYFTLFPPIADSPDTLVIGVF